MKYLRILLTFVLICFSIFHSEYTNAQGQDKLSKDSLYSEFRYFINLLEETHPDPYNAFGGKVAFHQEVISIEERLKSKEYTIAEYLNTLSSFLAVLQDGHTIIKRNNNNSDGVKYIPIQFYAISDGLIINGIKSPYKEYLGSKVLSINDIPIDTLAKNISVLYPSENIFGAYSSLQNLGNNAAKLNHLFPDSQNQIKLTITTPDNKKKEVSIDFASDQKWNKANFEVLSKANIIQSDNYLFYQPIEKSKTIYLKMGTVMARENFMFMHENGWNIKEQLEKFYERLLHKTMPENIDEAIIALPCFAEIFRNMLVEMRQNGYKNLIIDLRNNSGGWTPITQPTLYMLYGDKYLNTNFNTSFLRLISPLYMQKAGMTLEEFNKKNKSDYRYGEYIYEKDPYQENIEQKRQMFVKDAMGDAKKYIEDLNGNPLYTPDNIFVLTNTGTFSAAFHYAFYLWRMGAKIVGVPSSQAPNTFMEMTEFILPYTKVKGSISNSAQYFLPSTDKRAKIFWPDMTLEYKDYKKYNFDQETELLWLLDRINN